VKLTKAGREFKACCPFHNEKTPSFYVNDDKGFYHCFGCSAHGDAIRFLTDARGLPFMDAVKELAEAAGMEVPAADPRAQAKAERANSLYDVMTAAQRWFEEQLGGSRARRRGLTWKARHPAGDARPLRLRLRAGQPRQAQDGAQGIRQRQAGRGRPADPARGAGPRAL
jgi:DNA primase catalytic core